MLHIIQTQAGEELSPSTLPRGQNEVTFVSHITIWSCTHFEAHILKQIANLRLIQQ